MSQPSSKFSQEAARLVPVPLPVHCECDHGGCQGEVVAFETSGVTEMFIRVDPASIGGTDSTPQQQARHFYECLPRILGQGGLTMSDVMLERIFYRDLQQDFDVFQDARRAAYGRASVDEDYLPAASAVGQPPCTPGQAFELQVYAVGTSGGPSPCRTIPSISHYPAVKIVEIGGFQHLYVRNVTGCDSDGCTPPTFRQQSDAMFDRLTQLLKTQGVEFSDVLRTWCYLSDIDRDYDEFNVSRNAFFRREGLSRLPASTGIRASLFPASVRCSVDCYTLLNPQGAQIEVMHAPTLNEAPQYGSAFSRGMKVVLPGKTVLYVSGTASVDERGRTAHVGNSARQIERMLLNLRELLAPHNADLGHCVQVISYLKSIDDFDLFREITHEWGLAGVPNSIVNADICRPDLLCEVEALAVLPDHSAD